MTDGQSLVTRATVGDHKSEHSHANERADDEADDGDLPGTTRRG
jgi:hypothetical protein